MDVTTVAGQLVEVLAPFLPFLAKMGQEAAEKAGRQLGADAWEDVKDVWTRLSGRLEERPAAAEAVQDVTNAPEDEDARAALRLQLRKLLDEDQTFARELHDLLAERSFGPDASVVVTSSGERSIAVGGDVKSSRLMTGDQEPRSD